jgi:molecular chaperone DnaJ
MDKDFYKLLGVDRKATDVDIKKAYRKLARKYHPDLNPGSKTAEAKFKEIQEAYSVLSDPKKKRQYDQFGFVGNAPPPGSGRGAYSSGFDGFDFSNIGTSSFGDFFQNIFGGTAHPQQKKTRRKGENLHYTMKLSFDDAINGIKTRIQLTRMVPCTVCHGNGYIMTRGMQKCPTCGGTGQIRMQKGFMMFHLSRFRACQENRIDQCQDPKGC